MQKAGLLDDKKATTHWLSLGRLRAFVKTTVIEERFVIDGNIWSSSGVSAGIDLALAFIAQIAGDEVAGKVQSYMEYYPSPKRYGNFHESKEAPQYLKQGRGNKSRFFQHEQNIEVNSNTSLDKLKNTPAQINFKPMAKL